MMKIIPVSLSENDPHGNFAAIEEAAAEVRARGGHARICFTAGRFPVWNEKGCRMFDDLMHGRRSPLDDEGWRRDRNPLIDLADCSNVEVDGGGVLLELEGLVQPVACFRSSAVTIKNLSIDYRRPPYTVGTITRVEDGTYYLEVGEYPVYEGSPVVAVHTYDPATAHLTGTVLYYNQPVQLERPGLVKMTHRDARRLRSGDTVFLRHIYSFAPGLQFYRCRDVRVEDVTLHAHPGMGIIGHLCHDVHVSRFRIEPSAGRILSINVDGTHFISCTGTVTVEDSYFEGMGDDASNIHSFYFSIVDREDDRTLHVKVDAMPQDFYPDIPDAGDTLEFVRVETLAPYSEGRLEKVEELPDGTLRLVFEYPVPDEFRADDVLSNISKLAAFRFLRNTVKNIRGRAALVQTRDALVEGGHFEYCTGQGVHIDTATGWWESGATRNVRILNNWFDHCGFGSGNYCGAAGVVVGTECAKPEPGVHRDIVISGNYITGSGGKPALLISCASNVRVEGNRIENCSSDCEVSNCTEITQSS